MTIFLGTLAMIGLLVIGVPVAYALGIAGSAMLLLVAPLPTVETLLTSVVHHSVANYVILTIPAFVMMSEFLSAGGIADDMMIACNRMLRKLRGGLAVACVLAGAVRSEEHTSELQSLMRIS